MMHGQTKIKTKYACLSEGKSSHSHKTWAEFPSFA